MPRVRDLLYRFRPSGAPGAATAAGVPVDRATEMAAELDPVFAKLAETERECATILERARLEAAETRTRDEERARSVLATGRARLEAERASAAAQARASGRAATSAATHAAEAELADLRRRIDQVLPLYVDRVVASVRSLLGTDARTEAHPEAHPEGHPTGTR